MPLFVDMHSLSMHEEGQQQVLRLESSGSWPWWPQQQQQAAAALFVIEQLAQQHCGGAAKPAC